MKILMINKFLHPNGGSETYMFRLGQYLCELGHQVEYFGMEHENRCVGNTVEQYTANMDFHKGSKFSKILYPIKTIYSKEARKKIRMVLENFKPDVCHINNFNYQLTPSIILEIRRWEKKSGNKCKIVYTAHDYQLICPNHMLYNPSCGMICEKCIGGKFINCTKNKCIHGSTLKSIIGSVEGYFWKWKKVYKDIDAVVCCSHFMKTKIDTNPILEKKTVVLHNFIEAVEWENIEKEDYVLYFGRFSKEKGIGTLIETCKKLPDIKFVFAGTGPLEDDIKGIENIENVGFKKGLELEKLIKKARFSIYPSEWFENCPFSVMESQMYGTPVLGADIGGIPELIKDMETGELFVSGDPNALSSKISSMWNDSEKTRKYTENCATLSFDTIKEYTEKLMEIYR